MMVFFIVIGYIPTMSMPALATELNGQEPIQVSFINTNGPFKFAGLDDGQFSSQFNVHVPVGNTIGSMFTGEVGNPVHDQGYNFIGWREVAVGYDDSGEPTDWYVKNENDDPISTEDMLQRVIVPDDENPIGFMAIWEEGDDGPGNEGPGGPMVGCAIYVNNPENPITQELFPDSPWDFQCAEGDKVVLTVDTRCPDFDGIEIREVSWFLEDENGWSDMDSSGMSSDNGRYSYTINPVSAEDIDEVRYVCVLDTDSGRFSYKFAPCTEVFYGPEYNIPQNIIIINYWFYTSSGQENFFPIYINLDNLPQDTTIQQIVDKYGQGLSGMHYKDSSLIFDNWEITGGFNPPPGMDAGDVEIGNCGGGFEIYVHANYKNDTAPVQVNVTYYDKNANKCTEEHVVVVSNASSKSTKDVYNTLVSQGQLPAASKHHGTFEWVYLDRPLFENPEEKYIPEFRIVAAYEAQPLNIKYTYRNEKGESVTISGKTTTQPGKDIYTAFEKFLTEKGISTNGVTGWAINPQCIDHQFSVVDTIDAAAIYSGYKPAYVIKMYMDYDSSDNSYHFVDDFENPDIVYVTGDYPNEIDYPATDAFSLQIHDAINTKYTKDAGKLNLISYEITGTQFDSSKFGKDNKYMLAPEYTLYANYDKVYVEVIGHDGSVKQYFHDPNAPFELDYENESTVWNKEIAQAGGTSIPSGSEVSVEGPFTRFSAWTMSKESLKEVPEELKGYFTNISEIQTKMYDAAKSGNTGLETDGMQVEYYEVELYKCDPTNGLVSVKDSNFPTNGIWVSFDYPEGTDKNTTFAITHMFTEGSKAGQVEIITEKTLGKDGQPRLIKTERCIKVLMYSLSPIGVLYGEADDSTSINDGQSSPGTTEPDGNKVPNTGDTINLTLPLVIAILSVVVMAALGSTRRKLN